MKFYRVFPAAIAASLVLSLQIAYAKTNTSTELADISVAEESIIVPYWAYTNALIADLTINNGVAKPIAVVKASSTSAKITGELYLQKKTGSKWLRIKTWSISGIGSINVQKSYAVASGEIYRSRVVVDVEYNGNYEHIYANSGNITA